MGGAFNNLKLMIGVSNAMNSAAPYMSAFVPKLDSKQDMSYSILREKWKLMPYYELLHRKKGRLSFTAGHFGTISQKWIFKVG